MSITEQLSRIEASGRKFHKLATELSICIESLEDRLLELPGIVLAAVDSDGITLSLEKLQGGWGLFVRNGGEPFALRSAPVQIKARAAHLLLPLLKEIEAEQDRIIALINQNLPKIVR